jgi:hypothetical protein
MASRQRICAPRGRYLNHCLLIVSDLGLSLSRLCEAPQRIGRRGDVDARREGTPSTDVTGLEPLRFRNNPFISGAQAMLSDFKNPGSATVTEGQSP